MDTKKIIVIGASMGGFEAIKSLITLLPSNFEAPIFIVWHMSPEVKGILPAVLNKLNSIIASNAIDGEDIKLNHIYVAPPDHHLLLERGSIKLSKSAKENMFRPSVDPLFRSAAENYGDHVIGIILSGALDDGTSGLGRIKAKGGITIVQDPQEAINPSMPLNALNAVDIDYCLKVADIPDVLHRLLRHRQHVEKEIDKDMVQEKIELSTYSCPECHGVLSAIMEDNIIRYQCHTGHAYSENTLLLSLSRKTEESLYNVMRGMHETVFLLNHMGDHYAEGNNPGTAAAYFNEARKIAEQLETVGTLIHNHQTISPDKLNVEPDQR